MSFSGGSGADRGDRERIPAVEPAPHEFSGNLIFTDDGLDPFYAFDAAVKAGDGSRKATVRVDGVCYDVTLYYQESGLKAWDDPSFELETVREYRLKFEAQDEVGERSGTFHVQPRWPDMESKDPDKPDPSTPEITGVNVRVDGSNLPIETYPRLLREAASAVDVNPSYFTAEKVHEYSNIFAYELYVRIDRERSERLIGMNGPIRRIFEHVESADGFRELREDDREVSGYHHRVTVSSDGASRLLAGHGYGKRVKHYHPEHPREDPEDELYHPKVGVSLQPNVNDGGSVSWDARRDLKQELDEFLVNLLDWGGLPTRANSGVYQSDAYFRASESSRRLRLSGDPTPELKRKQESVVIDGLTANPELNDSDREVLEVVTDGGRSDVLGVAEETGFSKRTVYRVVNRLSEILRVDGGRVGFVSEFLQETVRDTLRQARDAIERDGVSPEEPDPFSRWANAHGVEVDDPNDDRLVLRFGELPEGTDLTSVLERGLRKWVDAGREASRFRFALVAFRQNGQGGYRDPALR